MTRPIRWGHCTLKSDIPCAECAAHPRGVILSEAPAEPKDHLPEQ